MRPLRLLLSLSTSLLAVTLLLYVVLGTRQDEEQERMSVASRQGGVKALFSFASPGSLFPPSAIISLTDDNSTFFLARPAAFGPGLPSDGLSGSLWVGSGFSDDAITRSGELGCNDVPGWDDGSDGFIGGSQPSRNTKSKTKGFSLGADMSTKEGTSASKKDELSEQSAIDDGTDDHLQSSVSKTHSATQGTHADIQSIQESAEIAGKVVLLKRGGCGFRAKVQWAQSRGGVAVIVGDDVRGGALVRMYARDDTSNITIPSLFTSHTTAHLLSSLLPADGVVSGTSLESKAGSKQGVNEKDENNAIQKQDGKSRPTPNQEASKKQGSSTSSKTDDDEHTGWMHSLLAAIGFGRNDASPKAGSRRVPSSGDLNWIQVGDWDDDQQPIKTMSALPTPTSTRTSSGFVIGEQDWRDPDLIPLPSSTTGALKAASTTPVATNAGSNVLPGSGEYSNTKAAKGTTWWSKLFSSKKKRLSPLVSFKHAQKRSVVSITGSDLKKVQTSSHPSRSHEGLWVTLTPTNVSSSPFFDTLLVLVVSPLVTLTVVYALLLLRSRIRRRRWRAPKSVVERLPVRTYQTISESSVAATPSAASSTTPLLQHLSSQPASPVSRPRSTTEPEVPPTSSVEHANRDREEEKRESGLAAWRRRYGGRQRECVVCLEEYVDGVSQVMSLPCGHEFHAECM
jgi:hypothetical protein